MATQRIDITKEGQAKLQEELRELIDKILPATKDEVEAARKLGDLSENADYSAAREKLSKVESRIAELEEILANASIIESGKGNVVSLGSKVTFKDNSDGKEYTYSVVGTIEADPLNNLISNVSPIGVAIMGKKVGAVCMVKVAKEYTIEILKIESSK